MGDTLQHLLGDAEVVVCRRGHQGLVGDAKHLALLSQAGQQLGHGAAHPTAHARVDLIEKQGDVLVCRGQTGFQSQQKARHLTA